MTDVSRENKDFFAQDGGLLISYFFFLIIVNICMESFEDLDINQLQNEKKKKTLNCPLLNSHSREKHFHFILFQDDSLTAHQTKLSQYSSQQ